MAQTLAAGTADKVRKLLETLRDLREKETAVLGEIESLMGGGLGIGQRMKVGYVAFADMWEDRYPGSSYVFAFQKDAPLMKRLLSKLSDDELAARIGRYLQNPDPWLVKNRHPFGAFVSQINQYAQASPMGDDEAEDDVSATQRRLAVLRGEA
jgi:hypothetical protein